MVVDKANRKKISRVAATAALAGVLAIGAGGCAAAKPAGSSSGSAPVHKEQAKKTPAQLAAAAYREVLEDPQGYFGRNDGLDEQFVADAEYTYALVNMSTGELPQLLVCATGSNDAWNGMESVQVFSFDAKSGSLIVPTGISRRALPVPAGSVVACRIRRPETGCYIPRFRLERARVLLCVSRSTVTSFPRRLPRPSTSRPIRSFLLS